MRRDWPLVVGLIASAAVVFGSTRVDAGVPPVTQPAAPASSASDILASLSGTAAAKPKAKATATATATPAATPAAKKKARSKPRAASRPVETPAARKRPKPVTARATPSPARTPTATPAPVRTPSPTPTPAPTPAPPTGPVEVTGDSAEAISGDVTFTLQATGHRPKVGDAWSVSVTAARGGRSLKGHVTSDVLFDGKPVQDVEDVDFPAGGYRYDVVWPQEAAGYPVIMRFVVRAGGRRQTFLYAIKVR